MVLLWGLACFGDCQLQIVFHHHPLHCKTLDVTLFISDALVWVTNSFRVKYESVFRWITSSYTVTKQRHVYTVVRLNNVMYISVTKQRHVFIVVTR